MMDREEILARSRNENRDVLDEREKSVQTKSNSISQGVGMVLCILIGAIGLCLTGWVSVLAGCTSILWGMFAAERVAYAVKLRSLGHWVLAGALILGFVAMFIIFLVSGMYGWRIDV